MDSIIQALQHFFGEYVVALAVVIIAAVWGIWKLASAFQSMRDKVKEIDDLPCAHHSSKIDKHDEQFSDARALMGEMKGQLDLLIATLVPKENKRTKAISPNFSRKHSPRTLNEAGLELLKISGGEDFLKAHADFFIKKIEALAPKTPLDVEDFASMVLLANRNDDRFIPLKNWVYNAPTREITNEDGTTQPYDAELDDVIFVMSLPLRDRYLELHPEIIQ